MRGKLH